ncbi:hypothetical protein [Lactobacillus ultunensis]|nr:hypothetical protein [Lactobacillus ultunensis]KRL82279.1 hypothetical protein FC57_GL001975 [Lactobacillus ultunensis DSM 16047]QQP28750.1 hypothetical protein H4B44_01190 [Lactobacillus ultunensis]
MEKQLSLFSTDDLDSKELKPEDKEKNTQASYSAWGWLFQITAAIVMGLKYRKNLTEIKVEGKTEDIELYFKNKKPIYVQAKSTGKSIEDTSNATQHCTAALNTLINTSNIKKNNYSQLIYISNFLNPLKLTDEVWRALWKPNKDELLVQNYANDIPKEGKDYLNERADEAKNQLKKGGYLSTDYYFDWNKVSVATLIFSRKNEENLEDNIKECAALNKLVDEILERDTNVLRDNIEAELYRRYGNNATNFKLTIKKNEICSLFIYKIVQGAPETYLEKNIPIFEQADVETYAKGFIDEQSQNIEVINKILADFYEFDASKYNNEDEKLNAFIDQEGEDKQLKSYFPMDEKDEEIQKGCLKYLTYKILYKQRVIKNTREEFSI